MVRPGSFERLYTGDGTDRKQETRRRDRAGQVERQKTENTGDRTEETEREKLREEPREQQIRNLAKGSAFAEYLAQLGRVLCVVSYCGDVCASGANH